MPTSARWEVANLPQISVKPVHSAGGQSRPPLQERAGGVVGADDSVGPKNITNSPRIPVKPVHSARADVGIGPYNEIWWCTRGCIGLCFSPLPAATPQALRASSPFRGAVILLFPPRPFPAAAYRRRRSGRRRRSPVPRRTRPAGGKGR